MKNVFLIGFMGSGKSTVASCLADKYGMNIVEMDQMIVEREGMSIPDIFAQRGEIYFRDAETKLLDEIQSGTNMVISCGGGVVLRDQNVKEMKKCGKIVLLNAKPETILARVKKDENRPLLQGNKNIGYITDMMEQRQPKYENAADFIVETDGKDAEEICKEIFERIGE